MEISRLNELLLMFTESQILEYVADHRSPNTGYLVSGHCGIAAYMILTAMYVINKKNFTITQFLVN